MYGFSASSLGGGGNGGEIEHQRSYAGKRGGSHYSKNSGRGVLCWLEERLVKQHPGWIRPGVVWMLEGAKLALFASSTSVDDEDQNEDDYDPFDEIDDVQENDQRPQQSQRAKSDTSHCSLQRDKISPLSMTDESPSTEYARGGAKIDRMILVGESSLVYAWTPEEASVQLSNEDFIDLMKRRCELELPDVVEIEAEVEAGIDEIQKMDRYALGVIGDDGMMGSTSQVTEHNPSKNHFKRLKSPVSVGEIDSERIPNPSDHNDAERPFASNAIGIDDGEGLLGEAGADKNQRKSIICCSSKKNPYRMKIPSSGNGDCMNKPSKVTPTPKRPLHTEDISIIPNENKTSGYSRGVTSPCTAPQNSFVQIEDFSTSMGIITTQSVHGTGGEKEAENKSHGNSGVSTKLLHHSSLGLTECLEEDFAEKPREVPKTDVANSKNHFHDSDDLDSVLDILESTEKNDDNYSSDKLHPSNRNDTYKQVSNSLLSNQMSHTTAGENPRRKSEPNHLENS